MVSQFVMYYNMSMVILGKKSTKTCVITDILLCEVDVLLKRVRDQESEVQEREANSGKPSMQLDRGRYIYIPNLEHMYYVSDMHAYTYIIICTIVHYVHSKVHYWTSITELSFMMIIMYT